MSRCKFCKIFATVVTLVDRVSVEMRSLDWSAVCQDVRENAG